MKREDGACSGDGVSCALRGGGGALRPEGLPATARVLPELRRGHQSKSLVAPATTFLVLGLFGTRLSPDEPGHEQGKGRAHGPAADPAQPRRRAHAWPGVPERVSDRGVGAALPGRGGGLTSSVPFLPAPQAERC